MKTDLISVIVPVYNTEAYLGKCLDSICGQTFKNIEILCVYTASADGSLRVLEAYRKKDPRIQIIRRDDGGLGGARNTGMDHVRGDYILFVDSDDWIKPETCAELLDMARKNSCDAVIAPFLCVDSETEVPVENAWCSTLDFPAELEGKVFSCDDLHPDHLVYSDAPVVAWNKLYSAGFLKKHGLRFQEELRYEDNLFYYKVLIKAKRLLFTQKQYYFYRVNRKQSLQGSSMLSESMFDIFPALYGVKELLLTSPRADVWPYAQEYILSEFEWRYFSMMGKQRRFLKKLMEQIDREDYDKFVGRIREKASEKEREILELGTENLPQVTVIIPVYNCGQYIEECIESVLSQTLTELEVICVDDKSKDDSAAVVRKIAGRDGRVKLIESHTNSGAGTARNIGLRHARGEFIFFLDGDDLLPSRDVLQTMYTAAIKHAVYAVGGNMNCFKYQTPELKFDYGGHKFSSEGLFQYESYTDHPTWGFTRFLYNHEFIISNSIAFPDCRYYEDPYFFVCFMAQCRAFWSIPEVVYTYRVNDIHHVELNYAQIQGLLVAMREILPRLKTISLNMYYAEYKGMLNFFHEIEHFLSVRKNRGMRPEITRMADEILGEMDFSASQGYLSKAEKFSSFRAFTQPQPEPEESAPQGLKERLWRYSQKHPALYRILHAGNMAQRKARAVVKKAYGSTMRWIFRPVINGILEAKNGELYAKTCELRAEISSVQSSLQNGIQSLRQENKALLRELLEQNEQLAKQSNDTIWQANEQAVQVINERAWETEMHIIEKNQQWNEQLATQLSTTENELARRVGLLENSVNGQEKWEALQIKKMIFNLQFMCEKNFIKERGKNRENAIYGKEFYDDNRYESVMSGIEVFRVLFPILSPKSILDIGCGTGTWLYAAKKFGVQDVHGVDGDYVDVNSLMIEPEEFEAFNLEEHYQNKKQYDLAISLEVAEHLDEKYADTYVENLCGNSDLILFSAAHPGQGGDGHLNEQPLEYWKEKIERKGYLYIDVRPLFAKNDKIAWWYRDNIALFIRHNKKHEKKEIDHLIDKQKFYGQRD